MSICNTSTLEEYVPSVTMPWDTQRAHHFYRRIAYGASPSLLADALTKTSSDLVDEIILEAQQRPYIEDPGWGFWDSVQITNDFESTFGINIGIYQDTLRYLENRYFKEAIDTQLTGKLLQFWHNHFVTLPPRTPPTYWFQNFQTYSKHLIGNFKEFVHAVGRDSKMLIFLNGWENKATAPNENYARELYELFTLGVDNGYTEQDIEETARALTGYNRRNNNWLSIYFNEATFDSTEKTIFGRTGNWGYDDVINILFEEKGELIAEYICTKLYKFFVSYDVNIQVVNQLAVLFVAENFEIAPVLKMLFKSKHFVDETNYGSIIKSPQDLLIGLVKDLPMEFEPNSETNEGELLVNLLRARTGTLDTRVFDFPNVAGYPGDEAWLSSVTIISRWESMSSVLWYQNYYYKIQFENFVQALFNNDEEVSIVVKGIVDYLLPKPLVHQQDYDNALDVFKEGIPEVYFTDGTWTLDYEGIAKQLYNLLRFIVKLPEYQLT